MPPVPQVAGDSSKHAFSVQCQGTIGAEQSHRNGIGQDASLKKTGKSRWTCQGHTSHCLGRAGRRAKVCKQRGLVRRVWECCLLRNQRLPAGSRPLVLAGNLVALDAFATSVCNAKRFACPGFPQETLRTGNSQEIHQILLNARKTMSPRRATDRSMAATTVPTRAVAKAFVPIPPT